MKKIKLKKKKTNDFPIKLSDNYFIEIYSGKVFVLSGVCEIETLEKTVLKIKFGAQSLIFKGNDIDISNYSLDGTTVSGKIECIEFK